MSPMPGKSQCSFPHYHSDYMAEQFFPTVFCLLGVEVRKTVGLIKVIYELSKWVMKIWREDIVLGSIWLGLNETNKTWKSYMGRETEKNKGQRTQGEEKEICRNG